jgi:hypothetical protein
MKKQIPTKKKRLVIETSSDLHQEIKKRALNRKLTVREWVLLAITDQINREMIEEI